MAKAYKAVIAFTIYPDENGILEHEREFEDEDKLEPRTLVEIYDLARQELWAYIMENARTEHIYHSIWNGISIEEIEEENK